MGGAGIRAAKERWITKMAVLIKKKRDIEEIVNRMVNSDSGM
jgi:hypothetical protein